MERIGWERIGWERIGWERIRKDKPYGFLQEEKGRKDICYLLLAPSQCEK